MHDVRNTRESRFRPAALQLQVALQKAIVNLAAEVRIQVLAHKCAGRDTRLETRRRRAQGTRNIDSGKESRATGSSDFPLLGEARSTRRQ